MDTITVPTAPPSYADLHHLQASVEVLNAADEAFFEAASAHALTAEARSALSALRHAGDFLQQAAMSLATGDALASPEVLTPFRWAVMKVVEVNAALPEKLRGNLSADCFRPKVRKNLGDLCNG